MLLSSEMLDGLLTLNDPEEVRKRYKAVDLDPRKAMDSELLAELNDINQWANLSGTIVYWDQIGTGAHPSGLIGVNRAQLDRLFSELPPQQRRTAIFMALAHEVGHLCQFHWLGSEVVRGKPRIQVEAHADALAGVWLAIRLASGKDDPPEHVHAAAERLNSPHPSLKYPSTRQRIALVQEGQGLAAGVLIVEHQAAIDAPARLSFELRRQDFDFLANKSARLLCEISDDDRLLPEEVVLDLLADLNGTTADCLLRTESGLLELLLKEVDCVKVEVRGERGRHHLPHFHITFKGDTASYEIATLKRIVGHVPRKYTDKVVPWIRKNQKYLMSTWNEIVAGRRPLVLIEPSPSD